MISEEAYNYILCFLIGDDNFTKYNSIHYEVEADFSKITKGLIIKRSSFFDENVYGTIDSIPKLPLKYFWENPVLFGKPNIEIMKEDLIIMEIDIIAASFYLISRYEEMIFRDIRDEHKRFLGKDSLLYKSGNLFVPVLDYYGKLLRENLRLLGIDVKEPPEDYNSISLTHDIDMPWHNFNLFQAFRTIGSSLKHHRKLIIWPLFNLFGYYKKDPLYVFYKILSYDKKIKKKVNKCEEIYFIVAGRRKKMKSTCNYISKFYFKVLLKLLKKEKANVGWHISYEAANDFSLMKEEKKKLEYFLRKEVKESRNHFLRSCEPENCQLLCDLGIEDDYTMGFADKIGFRLGTSKNVKWINPVSGKLTDLKLHPLQIMDVTLTDYMKLEYKEALNMCKSIIQETKKNNGDLTLLWHNSTLSSECQNYTNKIYEELLNYIIEY